MKMACSICGILLVLSGLLMTWLSKDVEKSLWPADIKTGCHKDGDVVITDSGRIGGIIEDAENARTMKEAGEVITVVGSVIVIASLFIKKSKQIVC